MRILLIAHGYPPQAQGGTELYCHELARALGQRSGDPVFILTREAAAESPEYAVRREERQGSRVFFINHTFRYSRSFEETYRNPALGAVAAQVLDEVQPDIAHIQHLTCLGTDIVPELARRRVPTFLTLNDYWLICHRGQLLDLDYRRCSGPHLGCRRCLDGAAGLGRQTHRVASILRRLEGRLPKTLLQRLRRWGAAAAAHLADTTAASLELERRVRHMRWIASQLTGLLAPSETLRQRFIDFGIEAERIDYLPQGIDQRAFAGIERTDAETLRVGFLGSLMISKAPHILLEAYAGLEAGSASLAIYGAHSPYHGDDSYRERLEPLLRQPGVRHHGSVPHGAVAEALASIDVLVVPSIWLENAPFVIREAFAAGVPVVASDLGGMAEMVEHERSGLLFQPGDADDLRRALERLIDEPELLPRLRAGLPEMLTIEQDAAQLLALYRSALSKPPVRAEPRRLAAVVLNYRTAEDAVLAVRSLETSRRPVEEIIVVDNGSGEGSEAFLRDALTSATVVQTGANLGFSGGANTGLRRALEGGADLIFLLNADVLVPADCLGRLEEALAIHLDCGIAGPVTLAAADPQRLLGAGATFSSLTGRMGHRGAGELYHLGQPPPTCTVDAVDGCAMLIKRRLLEEVGLFDEDYFFTFEDLDLCLRARRAGYTTLSVGDANVYHQGSRSIGADSIRRLYFAARNHLLVAARQAPANAIVSFLRGSFIVALNLAHALLRFPASPVAGVHAVARGTLDHLRRRYGADG